jgi:hypothetical protein
MKFSFEEPHIWMQHALCLITMGQYAHALLVLKEVTRLLPTKVIPCLLAARICYEHLNQVTLCTGSLCLLLVISQILRRLCLDYCYGILSNKKKAIPSTGCGGLLGCEMLRIPHCLDSQLTDGSKVVSPVHRPRSSPQKHYFFAFCIHFC